MKKLTFEQMKDKLSKRFPNLEILCNSEFNKEIEPKTGFWLRNSESITYTEKDKNTLYQSMNNDFKNYEFEVYKKFNSFCVRFGWYATSESYTMQLFKL